MFSSDDFIDSSGIIFLVPFLATKERLAPFANDPIMWKRSIQLFRHLECQNLSIISEDIGRARMVQQFRNGGMEEERRSTVVLDYRILTVLWLYYNSIMTVY